MWKFQKRKHRYREQLGGSWRWVLGVKQMDESGKKVQIFSYKLSFGDIMYSMVTVDNTVLCI